MKKLLFIVALTVIACMAYAQSVAVIDMSIIEKSEYVTNTRSQLETEYIAAQRELQIRQENRFLSENEITDLIKLVASKGDQAKIKNYTDENNKRYDELQQLNQTKELSDEQKARLTELNNYAKKSGENFENREKVLSDNFGNLETANTDTIINAIKSACEKVAKSKKIDIVVEKTAVFYGGIDITKDVIAQLPKTDKK